METHSLFYRNWLPLLVQYLLLLTKLVWMSEAGWPQLGSLVHLQLTGELSWLWPIWVTLTCDRHLSCLLSFSGSLAGAYSHSIRTEGSRKRAETLYCPKQVTKPSQIQRAEKQSPLLIERAAKLHYIAKGMWTRRQKNSGHLCTNSLHTDLF